MNQWILDELDRFKWPLRVKDAKFLKERYNITEDVSKMSKTEVYNLLWPEESMD